MEQDCLLDPRQIPIKIKKEDATLYGPDVENGRKANHRKREREE